MALAFFALLGPCLVATAPLHAKVFLSQSEALELAFPGCSLERSTTFLTEEQRETAAELAGTPIRSSLVHRHRATCDGELSGVAYFDTHRVRTLEETIMVVVDANDLVRRIEILSFNEPQDYLPRESWYRQFVDRGLDAQLALDRGIRAVTGATLTARATEGAVRRILALHQTLANPP